MEISDENIWWIITLNAVVFIFLYRISTNGFYAMASKFEAGKNIRDSSDWIFNLVREALHNAGFKNIKFDKNENSFYAQTKVSIWSWSENIEVKINTNPLQSELKFKSICALFTQIFDWGKNKRNWIRFEKELDKLIISKLFSDNYERDVIVNDQTTAHNLSKSKSKH